MARRFLVRHLGFWAWSLVLILSLLFGLYFYQMDYVLSKKLKIQKGQSMDARLMEIIEEINGARDGIQTLRHEFVVLDNITNRQFYYRILEHLSDLFTGFSWLNQLAIEKGEDGREQARIQLTGFSSSNQRLGDLLSRLAESPYFQDVVLKETEKASRASLSGPYPSSALKLPAPFQKGGGKWGRT